MSGKNKTGPDNIFFNLDNKCNIVNRQDKKGKLIEVAGNGHRSHCCSTVLDLPSCKEHT